MEEGCRVQYQNVLFSVSHLILFSCHSGSCVTSKETDLIILLDILRPVTAEWKTVGLSLGFLNYELTAIERTPLFIPEGVNGYFKEMLSQWLRRAPPNHS